MLDLAKLEALAPEALNLIRLTHFSCLSEIDASQDAVIASYTPEIAFGRYLESLNAITQGSIRGYRICTSIMGAVRAIDACATSEENSCEQDNVRAFYEDEAARVNLGEISETGYRI